MRLLSGFPLLGIVIICLMLVYAIPRIASDLILLTIVILVGIYAIVFLLVLSLVDYPKRTVIG